MCLLLHLRNRPARRRKQLLRNPPWLRKILRKAPRLMRDVTIAAAARAITIAVIQRERHRNKECLQKTNWGAWRLPNLLFFAVPVPSAANFARIPGRPTPRARCPQLLFSSKPGGFILVSPELDELTPICYAPVKANASEKTEKPIGFFSPSDFCGNLT